ncbi:hypothetical protein W02_24710 [Nitrospira sp. KM1]|nr:hypothetical protein W02_24710 [Nitrospira sp. KM1]
MFTASPDQNALRQGDIISGLYVPFIKNRDLELIGKLTGEDSSSTETLRLTPTLVNTKYFQGIVKFLPSLTIVVSQCCDVEGRNGKLEAPSFVIAPIEPFRILRIAKDASETAKFQQNNLTDYSNFFYIEPTDLISEPSFVNLNRVFSIHQDDYPIALKNKRLQMTDECRISFKLKVANHFGRPTEEELSSQLYPRSSGA